MALGSQDVRRDAAHEDEVFLIELVDGGFRISDTCSATFAADGTNVTEGTLVRVLSWYDNEWGFATRMSDTALHMAKFL